MTKLQYPLCGPQVCLQRAACGPQAACLTCLPYRTLSVLWLHVVTCEACVHTPHRSQYAAITLTTSCTASVYLLLTKCVIFNQVLTVAPWWWFHCKPKHAGAVLLILERFSNSMFFLTLCASFGNWSVDQLYGICLHRQTQLRVR